MIINFDFVGITLAYPNSNVPNLKVAFALLKPADYFDITQVASCGTFEIFISFSEDFLCSV